MKSIDSLGFLEVFGFAAGLEAADAMLKSAQVRLVRQHEVNPGLITLVAEGDLASCRAAVNAGKAAAARIGKVVGCHVIGRPDKDTELMVLKLIAASSIETKKGAKNAPSPEKSAAPQKQTEKSETPVAIPAKKKDTRLKLNPRK